jgi:hypothetical protein
MESEIHNEYQKNKIKFNKIKSEALNRDFNLSPHQLNYHKNNTSHLLHSHKVAFRQWWALGKA